MLQRSASVSWLVAALSSEADTEGVVGWVEGWLAAGLGELRCGEDVGGVADWGDVGFSLRDCLAGGDDASSSSALRLEGVHVIIVVVVVCKMQEVV
jgi:hypothetical protein